MKKLGIFLFLAIFCSSCVKNWSYHGKSGPQYWGSLKEEFKFCKIGYNQSPIDVKKSDFQKSILKFSYSPSRVEKEQKNYVLKLNFYDKNFLLLGRKKYFLDSIEFHHPSEHLINGKPASLEMQITHKSDDEQLLKLAIFLESGKENPEFEQIIKLLNSKKKVGTINLGKILKTNDQTFFYEGSLTIPPCTEGVKWHLFKTPIEISKEQMNQIIKTAIFTKTNVRPVQQFHPEKY